MKNDTHDSASAIFGRLVASSSRWTARVGLIALSAVALGAQAQSGATMAEAMANFKATRGKPAAVAKASPGTARTMTDPGGGEPTAVDPADYFQNGKLIRAPKALTALGNDLFGDRVNLYRGTLEFVQTDVSLEGNNALPVAVTRKLTTGSRGNLGQGLFSEWELDIPRMSGIFNKNVGWVRQTAPGSTTNQRCSNFGAPPDTAKTANGVYYRAREYWQGNFLHVPGGGQQEVLLRDPAVNTNVPDDGASTPLVTTGLWSIRCLASLASTTASTPTQDQGEGFLAISPDGTRYRFDWLVTRDQTPLTKVSTAAGAHLSIARQEVQIFPTLITDRFGNTVSYTYDTTDKAKVLSIQSSDGRSLSFTYEAGSHRIKTVTDGTRTWTYNYAPVVIPNPAYVWTSLMSVVQPDGSAWDFSGMHLPFGIQLSFNGIVDIEIEAPEQQENVAGECDAGAINGLTNPGAYGEMVHPSGAKGRFWLTPTEHGRNGVPDNCIGDGIPNSVGKALKSRMSTVFALTKKEIWGPGLPTMTWLYSYDTFYPGWLSCAVCTGYPATVLVTDPEGDVTRHTFGNTFQVNEGQPLKVESGWNGSSALRTVETRYSNAFPNPVGISEQDAGDGGTTTRHVPVDRRVTTQQGTTFTYLVNSFDGKARPTSVTRSSSLGYSRTEISTYSDQLTKWVLSQLATVTTDGKISVSNVYDPASATLTSTTKFGQLQHSYTYRADGTLQTRKDGRNYTTTFGTFKRGIPQSLDLPTGASHSAVVNDIGRITSVTDEMGITTSYGYDAIGRLTSITPPAGWTPTTISYVQPAQAEFGLDIGHWRVIETTGNSTTATYLDVLWRPVFTRVYDEGAPGTTLRDSVKRYDSDSKVTYESYPKRFINAFTDTPPGKRTFYDALGRPFRTEADSELGVLTSSVEYLSGFQTRNTNARGKQSTQGFWVLDNPDQVQLAGISVPAGTGLPGGMSVSIARDVFGKPTSITRSGNGQSVTRGYVYDVRERLCRTNEPEVGSTVLDYDDAGNLAWRAPGMDLPDASCGWGAVPGAKKIWYSYDELNRQQDTTYGDGSTNIARTYWPDGKLKTINTSDGTAWSYDYNTLRLPTTETLTYGGKTATATWSYNANGHLSGATYPAGGPSVSYNPNALGEATQVGGYASGVSYHPNGAVAGYTLANGIGHTQTQNIRGLPERNQDVGVTNDLYAYDENGNVSAIADQQENVTTRAMTYDDLDRLWTATAPNVWGTATYTYDALDNIRTAVVGSRSSTMSYDARNRLDSVMTNGALTNYAYDPQGNITTKGGQNYWFDIGNRMWKSSLGGTYVYDGHGRRVFITSTDGTKSMQMYTQAGQMLWGDRTQTLADVPATVTGYTCSAGTVSGSLCISTSVYNATVTGYQCNPGDSLSGTTCTHTTTSSYGASIGSYVCNSGDSLSGSTCSHSTVNTYGATPIYACNAGDSLSGATCSHTSSSAATPVYTCPSGWSLSGTTCTTSTSTGATENPNCNGMGAPAIFTGFYACRGDAAAEQFGDEDPADICMQNYGGFGLQYETYQRKTNKVVSCVFRALVTYSCPGGTTLNGTQCTGSTSQAATIGSYTCPSGSLSGSSCLTTSTYGAWVSSYFCNAGDGLSGSTCSHTTTSTYGATPIYVCNPGDSLSGQTCTSVSGSTYAASPSGYACNGGDALSGATCTHTTQSAATPVYGCSGGTLSGTTCVGGTTTSTTAYIYLGKKQFAETTNGITQFAHTDALGSPIAHTTNQTQWSVLNRTRYEPYGLTAQGTKPSPATSVIGFTGHVNDAETDLVYMQQRYYDPTAARFLSVDPIVTDANTGKGFGLYTYAEHNPYGRIDPDGRTSLTALGVFGILVIGSAICDSCKKELAKGIAAIAQSINGSGGAAQGPISSQNSADKDDKSSGEAKPGKRAGNNNEPRGTLPRGPGGEYKPLTDAEGPHTVLGEREGSNGEDYTQGATFDDKGNFQGRTDVTNHGRGDHEKPHFHPAKGPASVGGARPITPTVEEKKK